MTTFLRNHTGLAIATAAGIALGTTATFILHRITNDIRRQLAVLLSRVESLRQDVDQLKALVEQRTGRATSSRLPGNLSYQSIHASSGEEDEDEFEEAYDGDGYGTRSSITSDDYQSLSSNGGPVTPLDRLLPQIDRLLDGNSEELQQAYDILSNCQHGLDGWEAGFRLYSAQYSDDVEFMLRFAKATSKIAQSKTGEEQKPLTFAAHDLAAQALHMTDGDNPQVHKWFAITLGCLSDFVPLKEKIENGFKFREHINKAMELDPDDYSSYHLCGRFCYSVYMLSWVERSAAAAIAGNPPSSTPDEALEYFLKAEDKNPKDWKENKLFIAKCYIQKGDYYETYKWLEKANQVPAVSPDDRQAQEEIDSLMYSYSGYQS